MAYTVYIPAAGGTYTRQEFAGMKELAKWAMMMALEDTPAPTSAPVAPAPAEVAALLPMDVGPAEKDDESTLHTCFRKEDAGEYAELYEEDIQKGDWNAVAAKFITKIFESCFKPCYMIESESITVIHDFLKFVVHNTEICIPEIDSNNPVPWWKAPHEFIEACEEYINTNCSPIYPLESSVQFYDNYKQLYMLFMKATHHSTWASAFPKTYDDVELAAADVLTNDIMRSWLRGEKPTDNLRIFFTRLFIAQSLYKKPGSTVGAAEFYDMVATSARSTLNLPDIFCKWIFGGITFTQLRTAMEAMGVTQVRRASGQQYIDVTRIEKGASKAIEMCSKLVPETTDLLANPSSHYADYKYAWAPSEDTKKEFFTTLKENGAYVPDMLQAAIAKATEEPKRDLSSLPT